jgi:hypothetical protein
VQINFDFASHMLWAQKLNSWRGQIYCAFSTQRCSARAALLFTYLHSARSPHLRGFSASLSVFGSKSCERAARKRNLLIKSPHHLSLLSLDEEKIKLGQEVYQCNKSAFNASTTYSYNTFPEGNDIKEKHLSDSGDTLQKITGRLKCATLARALMLKR